ncbi:lasso peptide biosynthesis PqqD family chaperone [Dehalobacter sp. TeCB1]|uniref:lasso peptide biosynthesis PqqD family chaperone n=1 Tax=Dehalobacter sp. TeCB1 TaxID=1843715 RepID=UPI00083A1BAF|nr:lasso peptide biosynthesis PqqD family chaperone [Dehalobacter sp. TeCB1]OCZ49469.1 pyrroloquinoline quinone biosynthesis protein [Dehalobacter sp. TeCB1]
MAANRKKINLESYVVRPNDLPTTEVSGEIVMMNLEKGQYLALDSVGSRIWELLEEEQAVKDIIKRLIDEYEVEEQTCQEHVLEFMNRLYEEGLLQLNEIK